MHRGTQLSPFAAASAPPPEPPRRKHGGGRPRTSPEATQTILRMLTEGESPMAAARAAGVSWPTVQRTWKRNGHTWPPPGRWKGSGGRTGGRPPRKLTGKQAAGAARRIEGGETKAAVARDLGVSRATLYRALAGVPVSADR